MEKIARMDSRKQRYLEKVLEKIERAEEDGVDLRMSMSVDTLFPPARPAPLPRSSSSSLTGGHTGPGPSASAGPPRRAQSRQSIAPPKVAKQPPRNNQSAPASGQNQNVQPRPVVRRGPGKVEAIRAARLAAMQASSAEPQQSHPPQPLAHALPLHHHQQPPPQPEALLDREMPPGGTMPLRVRMTSTWGDLEYVGLTGLELLDGTGSPLTEANLSPVWVYAAGQRVPDDTASRVLNERNKSIVERNMWKTKFTPPVDLVVHLPDSVAQAAARVRVWNYNQSVVKSAIGARAASISLGGVAVWSGELKRGCGNQIFDYSQSISLAKKPPHAQAQHHPRHQAPGTSQAPSGKSARSASEGEEGDGSGGEGEEGGGGEVVAVRARRGVSFGGGAPAVIGTSLAAGPSTPPENPPVTAIPTHPRKAPSTPAFAGASFAETNQVSYIDVDRALLDEEDDGGLGEESGGDKGPPPLSARDPVEMSFESLHTFDRSHLGRLKQGPAFTSASPYLPSTPGAVAASAATTDSPARVTGAPLPIPARPAGLILTFTITSTWGDPHYVGLCGIEVFNSSGDRVDTSDPSLVSANPSDVNSLPGGDGLDPRTPDKLVDGVNWTCDDLHMWLAPFTAGRDHVVTLRLPEVTELGMIRIWNYNKSRIHAARGARMMEIRLDGDPIFRGEVSRAPGSLKGAPERAEPILFTLDPQAIERLESDSSRMLYLASQADEIRYDFDLSESMSMTMGTRPGTAEAGERAGSGGGERPMTAAAARRAPSHPSRPSSAASAAHASSSSSSAPATDGLVTGRVVELRLLETWGDMFYAGLCGLALVGPDGAEVPLSPSMLQAEPRDMNSIPGHSGDHRVLENLVTGDRVTMDDAHMWLIPYAPGELHRVTIALPRATPLSELLIWNYNKTQEDTSRGVKRLWVAVDGKPLTGDEGVVVRRAPGHAEVDYVQRLVLSPGAATLAKWRDLRREVRDARDRPKLGSLLVQEWEPPLLPFGSLLTLTLRSTWGDPDYIGLDRVQVLDHTGALAPVLSISVFPDDREGMHPDDPRVPLRLLDAPAPGGGGWLGGFTPGEPVQLHLVLPDPFLLGALRVHNYSKTARRGAAEVDVTLDGSLIFRGVLGRARTTAIVFSNRSSIAAREADLVGRVAAEMQVEEWNDRRKVKSGLKEDGAFSSVYDRLGDRPTTGRVSHNHAYHQ